MSKDCILIIQKLVHGLQKDKLKLLKRKYFTNALEHIEAISLELTKETLIVRNMKVYWNSVMRSKRYLKIEIAMR